MGSSLGGSSGMGSLGEKFLIRGGGEGGEEEEVGGGGEDIFGGGGLY